MLLAAAGLASALCGLVVVVPAASVPVVSAAPAAPVYKVTMAARWCDDYTDIFGNRARNDIMESLRDLGPDTPYNPFVSVQPSVEDGRAPQSTCHPLPNWTFAFGTGINRPVPGTNLSFVTNPGAVNNRQITTGASTALLDDQGNPTGSTIAGATTFTLTANEVSLASQNSRFWVMGGTPSAPLNGQESTYGFGALRCAKDNLNGDNVEFIAYPSGATHVFCYAFYVKPPPESGVITVTKRLDNGLTLPVPQTFTFDGNLSFNPGGEFTVEVPAGTNSAGREFVRGAGGTPWTVNEVVPDGFVFVDVTCTSTNASSTFDITGTSVDITLGAGDRVNCTFTNDLEPPPAGKGLLLKQTFADPFGVPADALPADWTFDVVDPLAATHVVTIPVDQADGIASSGPIDDLTPGTWTVTERLPAPTASARWEFAAAYCVVIDAGNATVDVVEAPAPPSITVAVPAGGQAACSFVNRMVPLSRLTIRLTTQGGVGTFGFGVEGLGDANIGGDNDGVLLSQAATTVAAGVQVTATGDATDPLYGTWRIVPVVPQATVAGRWDIVGTPTCSVAAATTNVGTETLEVEVGAIAPDLVCDYVYRLVTPSTLDVVKQFGPLRAGQVAPVVISISCEDGSTAQLTVPVGGAAPARLATPLAFVYPTTCSVTETDNGSGGGSVTVTTALTVNGTATTRSLDALQVGTDDASETVVVTFTNSYSSIGSGGGTLPASGGGGGARDVMGDAVVLVALGTAMLVIQRRRAPSA